MKLASHNSWSYLTPKKWWMKLLRFTAQCQDVDIKTQYEKYGVRCFDLRVKFNDSELVVVHNLIEYKITEDELLDDLDWLNSKGDTGVRVLLDIRKEFSDKQRKLFIEFCNKIHILFKNIIFYEGRNLYNWKIEYDFKNNFSCEDYYASVCYPKIIDDWFPRLFAKFNNKKIKDTDKEYLMIDFVNYVRK